MQWSAPSHGQFRCVVDSSKQLSNQQARRHALSLSLSLTLSPSFSVSLPRSRAVRVYTRLLLSYLTFTLALSSVSFYRIDGSNSETHFRRSIIRDGVPSQIAPRVISRVQYRCDRDLSGDLHTYTSRDRTCSPVLRGFFRRGEPMRGEITRSIRFLG